MAVNIVIFDGSRLNAVDATTNFTDNAGGHFGGSTEPDFVYQGATSVSVKVGTGGGGLGWTDPATNDFSTGTANVWLAKVIATNSGVMNVKSAAGGVLSIGSGGAATDEDDYHVIGGDTYPIKGGWAIVPVDPNGTPSVTPGTPPTLTIIDWFSWHSDFSGASKSENMAIDAIDTIPNGKGLTIILGTGGDPDGTFADMTAYDEGEGAADGGRYGIISTQDGVLFITGHLTIGEVSSNATVFTDSGQVVVFPEAEFLDSVGFFGIDFDLSVSGTVITISDSIFSSQGTLAGAVDTRPDFTMTGVSGTATWDGCTFSNFRIWNAINPVTIESCIFQDGDTVSQLGAQFERCTFAGGTHGDNDAYLDANNLALVNNCNFTFSDGYAIEYTGPATDTFSMVGHIFTGYGADDTTDSALFNPNTSGTLTINASDMSGLTINTAPGGTTVVNNTITLSLSQIRQLTEIRIFTSGTQEELTSLGGTNNDVGVENIDTNLISATLLDEGTSYTASDVLSLSGGTASTTATITVDTVGGGGEILTFTISDTGAYSVDPSSPNSPTGGTGSDASFEITMRGTALFAYNFVSDFDIDIVVMSLAEKYQKLVGITATGTSTTIPIQQEVDRSYLNP